VKLESQVAERLEQAHAHFKLAPGGHGGRRSGRAALSGSRVTESVAKANIMTRSWPGPAGSCRAATWHTHFVFYKSCTSTRTESDGPAREGRARDSDSERHVGASDSEGETVTRSLGLRQPVPKAYRNCLGCGKYKMKCSHLKLTQKMLSRLYTLER
jgi:hypothetical protein